jgi:hypothetical protein
MTVRRDIIKRVLDKRLVGGSSGAVRRRRGQDVPAPEVVEVPWEPDTTPVIDMLKATKPATQEFRSTGNVHVSDIINKCVRKIALMHKLKLRHPQESIMDGQGITFAIGDAVHDFVKRRFIQGHPDKVYARWSCLCGKEGFEGLFKSRPRQKCPECNSTLDKHNEVRFTDAATKLTGSPDLLLWMDALGAYYIVEIKSIAAESWKELARAEPNHKVQVSLYWWLLRRAGIPVVNRTSILYANKEYSFKFPYKEFVIDPQTVDLSPYMEDLDRLAEAMKGGELPPRVMCGTQEAPEAKRCPVRVTCFGCS